MLIDCPGCMRSYHISRVMLEPNGRTVACPQCSHVWFVAAEKLDSSDSESRNADTRAADPAMIEITGEAVGRRLVEASAEGLEHPAFRWGHLKAEKMLAAMTGAAMTNFSLPGRGEIAPGGLFAALRMGAGVALMGIILAGLVMASLGYRQQIVRFWPQAAGAYAALGLPVNLRGLAFHDVHMRLVADAAEPALSVDGEITNLKSRPNRVPPLRLSLRDAESRELYVWTIAAPKPHLAGGETLRFGAQLAAPPAAIESVFVSFAPVARDRLALQR